ncbi:regulator of G-protein signaling 22 [Gouania willdenowi]|uniref:regulator of G-protein signaling 22 n=1 Tax=Gouania willdenowi TaxID=441366 RepID=UPI001054865E|nr:regulator of G-protein signaling 22 [Gouania willdenowi]
MSADLSADFCRLTPGNFESSLASDDILAHYFNDFLSQPCFPEAVVYNQTTGLFEVMNSGAKMVFNKIRTALNHIRSALRTGDPTILARIPPVDNQYTVCCLHREEGIQWIKKERLPFFLQSDFYHEYRLLKFLLQWNPKCISSKEGSSCEARLCSSQSETDSQNSLKVCFQNPISAEKGPVRSHGTTNFSSLQKKCDSSECYSSSSAPERSTFSLSSADFYSSHSVSDETQGGHNSETGLSAIEEEQQHRKVSPDQILVLDCLEEQLEEVAAKAFKEVLEPTTDIITQTQANTSESFRLPGDQTNYCSTEKPRECQVYQVSEKANGERLMGKNDLYQDVNQASDSAGKTRCDGVSYYGDWISLDDFKEFLQGTPGEKLVNLWIDIERVKAIHSSARKSRYLVWMRSWYLSKCGHSNLSVELLFRLGLTTSPCWTEERLHSIQPYLSQSLLCYWAPRFWTSPLCQQLFLGCSPSSCHPDHDSKTQCFPLCPDNTCFIQTTHGRQSQMPYSGGELRSSGRMEEMLQVLCVDSCSGSYFTHFCEQSGNQLWVNAVYFWTDLQHYRALFYQDGLDLYRVQREAQLLVFTYISGYAERSLVVDEQAQRKVCDRLLPAFEELFDEVEEHALNILLEPWALLVNREKECFQQVCMQQQVCRINNQDFKDLQSLYEESLKQQKWVQHTSSSKGPTTSVPWSSVSPDYHGYRLGSLLLHNHDIGHFQSFLQMQDASIHLACWLDLEQYKETPVQDQAMRQELSTSITEKYLNNTYLFGPDSPATTEQQKDIVNLAGGLEHLKMECLSNLVAMEISDIVKAYIEKTWLPLFVTTPEFTERQKHKPKLAADRSSHYIHRRRRRRRRDAWKVEGLWMSSSKDILLFRQALLDPVTCQQFQHFVSLKGNFLENDLLFWLEVQRYKDLCHSHSDEATIQQKISTIISCFINSSIRPGLQIDIPLQQAQHILEKRDQLGPYIFREAQISVFGELLRLWPEFQEFRSSMEEEQLLPVLHDQRVKFRARVRRQRRKEEEEEEERREQEHLDRRESSREEEDTEEEDTEEEDTEEEDTEESQEREGGVMTQSPVQPLLWSYSRYMAGLQREEVRQNQLETFSTLSGSSHDCSIKSAFSKMSSRQSSLCSSKSRADSKRCKRIKNSVKFSNQV